MEYIIFILLVPVIVLIIIVAGVVSLFNNRNSNINHMDPNQTNNVKPKVGAKDFCLNLGSFIALYTLLASLLNLLFTVIDKAYPQITSGYNYYDGSSSISWPVSILIVFSPIFLLLMYFLEREYRTEPEKQNNIVHRGLTYVTLFVSALIIVGDLVTVVYYFVDGQELTTGFLLKVLVLLVVASSMFVYYISDLRNKLTKKYRIIWRFISGFIILGSIIWGFAVLGSPRTQQLLKYDQEKVSDLQMINNDVQDYYRTKNDLPAVLENLDGAPLNGYPMYGPLPKDPQSQKSYEYQHTGSTTYNLCAEFNKASQDVNNLYGDSSLYHPAGHYCFSESVTPNPINRGGAPIPVVQPQ